MAETTAAVAEPVPAVEAPEPTVPAPQETTKLVADEAVGSGVAAPQEGDVKAVEVETKDVETAVANAAAVEGDKAATPAAAAPPSQKKKSRWRRAFERLRAKLRRAKKTVGPVETPSAPSAPQGSSEPIKDESAEKKEEHDNNAPPEEETEVSTAAAQAPQAEAPVEAKETTTAIASEPAPEEATEKKE